MVHDCLVKIGGCEFPCVDTGFGTDNPVDVVIRPEDVELDASGSGQTKGRVASIVFKGVHWEMRVESEIGITFLVQTTEHFPVGSTVGISVDPYNIQIMHKPSSEDAEVFKKDEPQKGEGYEP